MTKKIVILSVVLAGLALLWISQRRTCGFQVEKISSDLSYHAEWDVDPTDLDLKIFDQPFTYLGKGVQCYAFASSDGAYVLKFFKHHHMQPSKNKGTKRRPELESDFNSYKIAFEKLPEETAVLYLHLNKTQHLKKRVRLIDKSGGQHGVDLDRTEFVVQRKADLVYPSLNQWMERGEMANAKRAIDSILEVISALSHKGIIDEDPPIHRNFGFIGTRAIIIDIGCFKKNERIADPVADRHNLITITAPLKRWLEEHHPVLALYLEEQLNQNKVAI